MVRFLHTSDWQIGMTRAFLPDEAAARYTQARFDAVRKTAEIAAREGCEFVVVAGDVFETNQVDRRTVQRLLEALRAFTCPVFLLPGNHDPLDGGSVFRMPTFATGRPALVQVLDSATPREVRPGVEVVGAPWTSKRPLEDLARRATEGLAATPGVVRVLVAHGAVDALAPDQDNPALVLVAAAEAALSRGAIQYVALGDRHSLTPIGSTGRIHYSGTPEVTDYDELDPGRVLIVDLDDRRVTTRALRVGTWTFERRRFEFGTAADLDHLERELLAVEAKERTVLKLSFVGTLTLAGRARLDSILERASLLFAAIETWERHTDLHVVPDDADFGDLGLGGYADAAVAELRTLALSDGPDRNHARRALELLLRLARPSS